MGRPLFPPSPLPCPLLPPACSDGRAELTGATRCTCSHLSAAPLPLPRWAHFLKFGASGAVHIACSWIFMVRQLWRCIHSGLLRPRSCDMHRYEHLAFSYRSLCAPRLLDCGRLDSPPPFSSPPPPSKRAVLT